MSHQDVIAAPYRLSETWLLIQSYDQLDSLMINITSSYIATSPRPREYQDTLNGCASRIYFFLHKRTRKSPLIRERYQNVFERRFSEPWYIHIYFMKDRVLKKDK